MCIGSSCGRPPRHATHSQPLQWHHPSSPGMAKRKRQRRVITVVEQALATAATGDKVATGCQAPGAASVQGGDATTAQKGTTPDPDAPSLPTCFHQCMRKLGFHTPTPVQQRCWPVCLASRDVLAIAPTGSGKTLGYLLPALTLCLSRDPTPSAPYVLVVCPTRELAQQVHNSCAVFQRLFSVRSCCAAGGSDKKLQLQTLREGRGVSILVGTPGRVWDLLGEGRQHQQTSAVAMRPGTASLTLDLGNVELLVLDEFDKILLMGADAELDVIRSKCGGAGRPQTLLFSATSCPAVLPAVSRWLRDDALRIRCNASVGAISAMVPSESTDETPSTDGGPPRAEPMTIAPSITQVVHVCATHKKPAKLMKFLRGVRTEEKKAAKRQRSRILVFVNKIKTAQFLEKALKQSEYSCAAMSSVLPQQERQRLLREFRCGKKLILIATDVAGRGLNVRGLEYHLRNINLHPRILDWLRMSSLRLDVNPL